MAAPSNEATVSGESVFSDEFVKSIADWSGTSLSPKSCSLIGHATTLHIGRIVDDARAIMMNCRRTTMTTHDISTALARRGIKPSFGYAQPIDKTYRQVELADGRDAVFARDDQTADVNALIASAPPRIPLTIQIKAHWLSISGAVPEVSANSTTATDEQQVPKMLATPYITNPPRILQLAAVRALAVHDVPMEKHAFFARITESVVCRESARRDEMIECLQTHVGLDSLVHPLCEWFVCGVQQNIATKNLALLIYLSRMMRALADNPHVSLVPRVHQLGPAVISCMFADRVCVESDEDSQWTFREFTVKLLLAIVCGPGHLPISNQARQPSVASRPDATHVSIMMRVIGHLHGMWTQPEHSTLTHLYMIAYFMCELSEPANNTGNTNAVDKLLVPHVIRVGQRVRALQGDAGNTMTTQDRTACDRLHRLMSFRLADYAQRGQTVVKKEMGTEGRLTKDQFVDKFGYFGEGAYKHMCNMQNSKSVTQKSGNLNAKQSSSVIEEEIMAKLAAKHQQRLQTTNQNQNSTKLFI